MFSGKGKQLCVFVGETDLYQHQSLFNAVLELLRRHGCSGATAFRGLAGFGSSSVMHSASVLTLSMDMPVMVVAIERPARIERVLAPLRAMAPKALIVVQDVEVVHFPGSFHEVLPDLKVADVMRKDGATVSPDSPVAQVLDLLEQDFTAVPVIAADGRVTGIISDYDLLNRGPEKSIDVTKVTGSRFVGALQQALRDPRRKVAELMTHPVETAGPDMALADAARVMVSKGLKGLPVVNGGGKLMGVVGRIDLLNTIAPAPPPNWHPQPSAAKSDAAVADVMTRAVATIDEGADLERIFELLVASPHKRLVVVDDNRHVLGVISDSDLLARFSQKNQPGVMEDLAASIPIEAVSEPARRHIQKARAQCAGELMTREVVAVCDTTPAADALLLTVAKHVKCLPVLDAHKQLAGIVGRAELMRALLVADR